MCLETVNGSAERGVPRAMTQPPQPGLGSVPKIVERNRRDRRLPFALLILEPIRDLRALRSYADDSTRSVSTATASTSAWKLHQSSYPGLVESIGLHIALPVCTDASLITTRKLQGA